MLHTDKYFLLPVYVDMGNQNTDTVTLAFAFSTTSTTRNWELKVSQIECWNAGRYRTSGSGSSLVSFCWFVNEQLLCGLIFVFVLPILVLTPCSIANLLELAIILRLTGIARSSQFIVPGSILILPRLRVRSSFEKATWVTRQLNPSRQRAPCPLTVA